MTEKETKEEKTWMPTIKWLSINFVVIVLFVVVSFFVLNFLLKSYMRDIPMELTPWLDKSAETQSIQEQSK